MDRGVCTFPACSRLSLADPPLPFRESISLSEQPTPVRSVKVHHREAPRLNQRQEATVTRKEVTMRTKRLTLQQRQEVFHALVTTQDLGLMSVGESRQHIEKQFEISEA